MQYSRHLIFKVLGPHKCGWRYTFLLQHLHKPLDTVNSKAKVLAKSPFSKDRCRSTLHSPKESWLSLEILIDHKINSSTRSTQSKIKCFFMTPDPGIIPSTSNPENSVPKFWESISEMYQIYPEWHEDANITMNGFIKAATSLFGHTQPSHTLMHSQGETFSRKGTVF